MDFQNRVGSKFGGGGPASAAEAAAHREARQYQLGLEAFDIDKDPYVVRNNLGQFVCKMCLTVHRNLPSYIAHTQVRIGPKRSPWLSNELPRRRLPLAPSRPGPGSEAMSVHGFHSGRRARSTRRT